VYDMFAEVTDSDGYLSRDAFYRCFQRLVHMQQRMTPRSTDDSRTKVIVDRLFDLFDEEKKGAVDFTELMCGISVLCGGGKVKKVEAAFNLYDREQRGLISIQDMKHYLRSVFKVLFESMPGMQCKVGVSPGQLAEVTAVQAFKDAAISDQGKMDFKQFQDWYMRNNGSR